MKEVEKKKTATEISKWYERTKNAFLVYLQEISIEFQEPSSYGVCSKVFTICQAFTLIRAKYTKRIRAHTHKHTNTRTLVSECAHPSHVHQQTRTSFGGGDLVCERVQCVRMLLYVRDEYAQRIIRHSFGYETIRGCRLNRTHEVSEKESAVCSSS